MKIDEAIQVKKFSTEWQRATVNLLYTSNWVTAVLEKRAEQKQITLRQFNVLRILRGQFPNPVTNNLIKSHIYHKYIRITLEFKSTITAFSPFFSLSKLDLSRIIYLIM